MSDYPKRQDGNRILETIQIVENVSNSYKMEMYRQDDFTDKPTHNKLTRLFKVVIHTPFDVRQSHVLAECEDDAISQAEALLCDKAKIDREDCTAKAYHLPLQLRGWGSTTVQSSYNRTVLNS